MLDGVEGGHTLKLPENEQMTIFDAAMEYQKEGVDLVVIGGKEYGSGSSRDWAAKGPFLLGIRAVIAESYERIHRSNLVGMGVLPLQFNDQDSAQKLNLQGNEIFDIETLPDEIEPSRQIRVHITYADGSDTTIVTTARIDTTVETEYYRNGGILQTVLRNMINED